MVQMNYHEARGQRAAVGGVLLLSGRIHALVGAGLAGGGNFQLTMTP